MVSSVKKHTFKSTLHTLPRPSRTNPPLRIINAMQIQPREEKHRREIKRHECPENPIVAPLVTVVDVEVCGLPETY